MSIHRDLPSTEVHEAKQIIDALTTDAGKVITPSATNAGQGELRRLSSADLSNAADVAMVNKTQKTNNGLPVNTFKVSISTAELGSNQATAYELVDAVNRVGFGQVVPSTDDAVRLPPSTGLEVGTTVLLYNNSADTVRVFPPVGGKVDDQATDASTTLASFRTGLYILSATTPADWKFIKVT